MRTARRFARSGTASLRALALALAPCVAAPLLAACSAGDEGGGSVDAARRDGALDGAGGSIDSGGPNGGDGGPSTGGGDGGGTSMGGDGDGGASMGGGGDGGSTMGGDDAGSSSMGGDGGASMGGGGDGGSSMGGGDGGGAVSNPGCGARELCDDGRDNNCDGRVDEGCVCMPGSSERCYAGPPGFAGVGACALGTQRCEGSGEFGMWGACTGSVAPADEACDGVDNNCNGAVDDVAPRSCYGGPAGTAGVGACRAGSQRCEGGVWLACAGAALPSEETCNGLDDDCDGAVDEDLSRACYSGPAGTEGVGACVRGAQRCEGGVWAACAGSGAPASETCNGRDDDCDGMTDEGLARGCYPGPAGTMGVGRCRAGTESCAAGSFGACVGAVTPVAEVCGNMVDDDCDGMTDEDCAPCINAMASSTPWEVHRVQGPVCFGRTFTTHGDPGEYELARIPPERDAGWRPVTAATIDFSETSALCGRTCSCLDGGEFTFFQTFFELSPGYAATSFVVNMGGVDDGARVTIFNSRHPGGVTDAGAHILLGGSRSTTDLARYLAPGRNRVLITHIDDCCSSRSLTGVSVQLNGGPLRACP